MMESKMETEIVTERDTVSFTDCMLCFVIAYMLRCCEWTRKGTHTRSIICVIHLCPCTALHLFTNVFLANKGF